MMPNRYSRLLAPFAFLYGLGVNFRNALFNWGVWKQRKFDVPVICVGNLAVGGTGKTPHVEYLVRLLREKYRVAVVSRGYRRRTKGFLLANLQHTYEEIGDEPCQILHKFPDIQLAVDSNRCRAIEQLLAQDEAVRPEIILLDDAYQHRHVRPSLTLLLTDYARMFNQDKLLPEGRLREPERAKGRADIVIITKTPAELKPIEYRIAETNLHLFAHQQVFFTHIGYEEMKPVFPRKEQDKHKEMPIQTEKGKPEEPAILALCGIASPRPFVEEVKRRYAKVQLLSFPDHHAFSEGDIRRIESTFASIPEADKWIVTTEKDATRLVSNPYLSEAIRDRLFYLPIRIDFAQAREKEFDQRILRHIETFQANKRIIYK